MQDKLAQGLLRLNPRLSQQEAERIAQRAVDFVEKCEGVEYAYRLASAAYREVR